jgi:predicted DNA-binding transcriptional regulator AlpA
VTTRERRRSTAAQITEAKKAAALKAGANAKKKNEEALAARAPPAVRLLAKAEVCAITGLSFPTIWKWMREGRFPRSRVVGGHSKWLSTDIDTWVINLAVRPYKGDAPVEAA